MPAQQSPRARKSHQPLKRHLHNRVIAVFLALKQDIVHATIFDWN
jgi:hypothetical protein